MLNGYVFFYNGRRTEISGEDLTLFQAKEKAIAYFKPPKSKRHMVHGMIAEQNGVPVVHTPTM